MSRTSNDEYDQDGRLKNGYDYTRQAWVTDGFYDEDGFGVSKGEPSKEFRLNRHTVSLTTDEARFLDYVLGEHTLPRRSSKVDGHPATIALKALRARFREAGWGCDPPVTEAPLVCPGHPLEAAESL